MTDIEWPEGATHRINGIFTKWVEGVELDLVGSQWRVSTDPWTLNQYMNSTNHEVIERPKEPEATEPVINWDEQPTPEHCWAEDLSVTKDPDFEGWCKKTDSGDWDNDNGVVWGSEAERKGRVRIHRKPEAEPYKPEVGSYCEVLDGIWHVAFFVGYDEDGYYVFRYGGSLQNISHLESKVRPIKSERDQVIEKAISLCVGCLGDKYESIVEATSGVLYDNGLLRIPDE